MEAILLIIITVFSDNIFDSNVKYVFLILIEALKTRAVYVPIISY